MHTLGVYRLEARSAAHNAELSARTFGTFRRELSLLRNHLTLAAPPAECPR